MNQMIPRHFTDRELLRRADTFKTLEEICQDLELTDTQFERMKTSYEAVAKWLSESDDPLLSGIEVYLQGSSAIGTSVKPIGRDEFDVDLIGLAIKVTANVSPEILKEAIGKRLAEHKIYATILEEKKRCWRLNYKGDFHLDVSPTIVNPKCVNRGELVPDKKLKTWHPTNPKAYKLIFIKRSKLSPQLTQSVVAMQRDMATVEPFPTQQTKKRILQRIVQLLKRHRDLYFLEIKEEIAPISVIITTLAMRSYEYCIKNHTFADELDVVVEVIRMMPHFIERPMVNGHRIYAVWNETTADENFADIWNSEPNRVKAFNQWHEKALDDFEQLRDVVGIDKITFGLKKSLGDKVVTRVMGRRVENISRARKSSSLFIAPAIGLTTKSVAASTPVPKNDFFGD